jgi:two-component system sensor histidine kinase QseC
MTLRLRLMAILGLTFTLLWGATSVWMLLDVQQQFRAKLDERLTASARMVAGLIVQLPEAAASLSAPYSVLDAIANDGIACEVRLLEGGLVARTGNSPTGLGVPTIGYSTRTIQGEQWRSYTLEIAGKRVTTADRVDKRRALLRKIIVATVVPFLVAMVGGLFVLWYGIGSGLRPLERIRQALANRAPDAGDPLPESSLPAELATLVATINLMLERTQGAIDRERRFTGDAAHELRTPLTAIKTHIQIAGLTCRDHREIATALEKAEAGVQRLQHTLEQLLTLARIEGPLTVHAGETASAAEIALAAINEIPAPERLRIVLEDLGGGPGKLLSPLLLTTALRNLLDNALRYSPENTPVVLRLTTSERNINFLVLDQGTGIKQADLAQANQRFWRKGTGQGSGLGLSIVEAIVKRTGARFELQAHQEGGTSSQISLPAVALKSSSASLTPQPAGGHPGRAL